MITTYTCEQCTRRYSSADEALACEARVPKDWPVAERPAIGDYVTCSNVASSYYDGDRKWSVPKAADMKSSSHFDHYDGFLAKWVVVAITVGSWHEQRYVLWTAANRHGHEQMASTSVNHYPAARVGPASPKHLEQAMAAFAAHKGTVHSV